MELIGFIDTENSDQVRYDWESVRKSSYGDVTRQYQFGNVAWDADTDVALEVNRIKTIPYLLPIFKQEKKRLNPEWYVSYKDWEYQLILETIDRIKYKLSIPPAWKGQAYERNETIKQLALFETVINIVHYGNQRQLAA